VVCSLWTDQSSQRLRQAQLRTALDQLEQQQRANEKLRLELADQGRAHQPRLGCTPGPFNDHLRREVDLSTREHREFAMVLIEIDPFNARAQASAPPPRAGFSRRWVGLLRGNTRAMDAACRLWTTALRRAAVGRGPGHRALAGMEGLRRQCAAQIVVLGGQELGFTVSMGVASFPQHAV
jgi:GGDEF domain-containing protein